MKEKNREEKIIEGLFSQSGIAEAGNDFMRERIKKLNLEEVDSGEAEKRNEEKMEKFNEEISGKEFKDALGETIKKAIEKMQEDLGIRKKEEN